MSEEGLQHLKTSLQLVKAMCKVGSPDVVHASDMLTCADRQEACEQHASKVEAVCKVCSPFAAFFINCPLPLLLPLLVLVLLLT